MKIKKIILFVLIISIILIFATGCLQKEQNEDKQSTQDEISEYVNSLVGTTIPDFELQSINGNDITQEDLKGKNTAMIYISSGCEACHDMLIDLEKINKEKLKEELGIELLVVSGDNQENLINLNKSLNTNIDYYIDETYILSDKLSLRFLPTTYFINEDLVIADIVVGSMNFSDNIDFLKYHFNYDENNFASVNVKKLEDAYKETHVGKKMVDFELEDNTGDIYKSSVDANKKRMIVFIDTNCDACKAIETSLTKIEEKYPKIIVKRIAGQRKEIINDYLNENNLKHKVLTDPTGRVMSKMYGVNFVPTILFINEENIIEDVIIGEIDGNKILTKVEQWNNN